MARRILILLAVSVVSFPLCLFLALVLAWPTFLAVSVGMTPLLVVAILTDPHRGGDRR